MYFGSVQSLLNQQGQWIYSFNFDTAQQRLGWTSDGPLGWRTVLVSVDNLSRKPFLAGN